MPYVVRPSGVLFPAMTSVPLSVPGLPGWEAFLSAGPWGDDLRCGGLPPDVLVLDLFRPSTDSSVPLVWSPSWGWRPLASAPDVLFPTSSLEGALAAWREVAPWLLPEGMAAALADALPPPSSGLVLAVLVMGS